MIAHIVSQFPSALDIVVNALTQIRDQSEKSPRASRNSLNRLHEMASVETTRQVPAHSRSAGTVAPASFVTSSKAAQLELIRARVIPCLKCPHLVQTRTQTVFGVGNPDAELMFIGEAPGADEDRRGEPFVGRAGQLLTKIIQAMGLKRSDVYIANILKCRPDMPAGSYGNRPPAPSEMQTCLPYLAEQITIIQPKVMVALGGTAVEGLLGTRGVMRELRGKWHAYQDIPLMITYHPSYLLRNEAPSDKRKVWEDMLQVMERIDCPISQKQRNYFL